MRRPLGLKQSINNVLDEHYRSPGASSGSTFLARTTLVTTSGANGRHYARSCKSTC